MDIEFFVVAHLIMVQNATDSLIACKRSSLGTFLNHIFISQHYTFSASIQDVVLYLQEILCIYVSKLVIDFLKSL